MQRKGLNPPYQPNPKILFSTFSRSSKAKQQTQSIDQYASKYNGVSLVKVNNNPFKSNRQFFAQIKHEGVNHHLGSFALAVDAALAYDVCAKVLKGLNWSKINFANEAAFNTARLKESSERGVKTSQAAVFNAIKAKKLQLRGQVVSKNQAKKSISADR